MSRDIVVSEDCPKSQNPFGTHHDDWYDDNGCPWCGTTVPNMLVFEERQPRIRVKPVFAWYDLWVGVFVDRAKRRIYIFPLPCLGVVVSWR